MRNTIAAGAAALLLLLAGCSQQTAGAPSAGDDPTSTEQSTTEPDETTGSSEPSEPQDSGLADVKPCDLADQATRTALGLTGGEEKTYGEARVCVLRKDGATLNESYTVQVEIFENYGIDSIVSPDVKDLPELGGRRTVQFVGTTGGCGVSVAVSSTSRVDSTAVGGDPENRSGLATQLATAVEPKLPR